MSVGVHIFTEVATASDLVLLSPLIHCKNIIDVMSYFGCAIIGTLLVGIDFNSNSKAKKKFKKVFAVLIIAVIIVIVQIISCEINKSI